MPLLRRALAVGSLLLLAGLGLGNASAAAPVARPLAVATIASPSDPDETGQGSITIYGAVWCGYCKALEATLTERKVPFDKVDVDQEPSRYQSAKKEAGGQAGIPLTSVYRKTNGVQWFVGNVPDAIEKAYRD